MKAPQWALLQASAFGLLCVFAPLAAGWAIGFSGNALLSGSAPSVYRFGFFAPLAQVWADNQIWMLAASIALIATMTWLTSRSAPGPAVVVAARSCAWGLVLVSGPVLVLSAPTLCWALLAVRGLCIVRRVLAAS